jgi:N-acetylglutamate synthase-like GNAT family acetyltransferase
VKFDDELGPCHELPWEFEVQQHINFDLFPPLHPPAFLHVGYDSDGLAAVIEMTVYEFDRYCFINSVAVAHRVSGNGIAGEALDRAHVVLAQYGITRDYVVEGLVDPDNLSAKSAFRRRGFEHRGERNRRERWAQLFDGTLS